MGQNESKTMTLHKMNLNDYCSHSLKQGRIFRLAGTELCVRIPILLIGDILSGGFKSIGAAN